MSQIRVQRYNKKSVPTRAQTNGRVVSDKWSYKKTVCRTDADESSGITAAQKPIFSFVSNPFLFPPVIL